MPMGTDQANHHANNIGMIEVLLKNLISTTQSMYYIFNEVIPAIEQLDSRHIFNMIKKYFNSSNNQKNILPEILPDLMPILTFAKAINLEFTPEIILEWPTPHIVDMPRSKEFNGIPKIKEYINRPDIKIIKNLNSFNLMVEDDTRNPYERTAQSIVNFVESLPNPKDDKALTDFFCYNFISKFFPTLVQHIKTNLEIINFYHFLHDIVNGLLDATSDNILKSPAIISLRNQFQRNFEALKNMFPSLKYPSSLSRMIIPDLQKLNNIQSGKELNEFYRNVQDCLNPLNNLIEALRLDSQQIMLIFSNDEDWSKLFTGNMELMRQVLKFTIEEQICLRNDIQNLERIPEMISNCILPLIKDLMPQKPQNTVSISDASLTIKEDGILKYQRQFCEVIAKSNNIFKKFNSIFNPLVFSLRETKSFTISKTLKNYINVNENTINSDFFEAIMLVKKIRMLGFLEHCHGSVPDRQVSVENLLAQPVLPSGIISNNNDQLLTLEKLLELPDALFLDLLSAESSNNGIKVLFNSIEINTKCLSSSDFDFKIVEQCYLFLINIYKFSFRLISSLNQNLQNINNQFSFIASNTVDNTSAEVHNKLKDAVNENKIICSHIEKIFHEIAKNLAEKAFSSNGLPKDKNTNLIIDKNRNSEITSLFQQIALWKDKISDGDKKINKDILDLINQIKKSLPSLIGILEELNLLDKDINYKLLLQHLTNPIKFSTVSQEDYRRQPSDTGLSTFFRGRQDNTTAAKGSEITGKELRKTTSNSGS